MQASTRGGCLVLCELPHRQVSAKASASCTLCAAGTNDDLSDEVQRLPSREVCDQRLRHLHGVSAGRSARTRAPAQPAKPVRSPPLPASVPARTAP